MSLPKGKLGFTDLERLVFRHLPRIADPREVPLDFTTVSTTGRLVAATDPVIGIPLEYYGFFAVHYAAADVSMAGAIPQFLTVNVCYPPGTPEKWLEDTMRQLGTAARSLDIQVLGGHTGGYDGLTLPIISSTCLGILPESSQSPRSIKPNDDLIAVGPVGRETLWFLANIAPRKIDAILSSQQRLQLARDLSPFMVASAAKPLSKVGVLLMHDLAEGGLATAAIELNKATGLGLIIHYEAIPWDNATLTLCERLDWNPLHCSSFGSFFIVTPPGKASQVIDKLKSLDRPASVIGKFTKDSKVLIKHGGELYPLEVAHDPYKDFTSWVT